MSQSGSKLYGAAMGGAIFVIIADLFSNADAAVTLKLGKVSVENLLGIKDFLYSGTVGLLIVVLAAAFICWLRSPKDKAEAFTLGLAVFALLNIAAPYKVTNSQQSNVQTIEIVADSTASIPNLSPVSNAYASEKSNCVSGELKRRETNAVLTLNKYVSSCKPYYSGAFGLSSFVNNKVKYCKSNHNLTEGTRVFAEESWETALRNYRYTKIRYNFGGKICTGWVSDGRGEDHHIKKDNT